MPVVMPRQCLEKQRIAKLKLMTRLRALLGLLALSALCLLLSACGSGGADIPDPSAGSGSGVLVTAVEPTPTADAPQANAPDTPDTPHEGRWIDVDVTRFEVQLMDGDTVLQTIGPVAVGIDIDTGAYESTQTGLFHVYNKIEDLAYDPPYDTYISHWVGFDPDKDNGFHSFLKDPDGVVVDPSTGRISNGCIRTGAAEAIFAFAELGMPVLVHT
jgi:L,D-transpeptidase catalytic domain